MMEILSTNDGLLTNIEVLELINDRKKTRALFSQSKNEFQTYQDREVIEHETRKYITSHQSAEHDFESIKACLRKLKRMALSLTEGELIQIANHMPSFQVEVYLVS